MSRGHLKGSSKLNKARAGTFAKFGVLHPSPENSSMQNLSSPNPPNHLPENQQHTVGHCRLRETNQPHPPEARL